MDADQYPAPVQPVCNQPGEEGKEGPRKIQEDRDQAYLERRVGHPEDKVAQGQQFHSAGDFIYRLDGPESAKVPAFEDVERRHSG